MERWQIHFLQKVSLFWLWKVFVLESWSCRQDIKKVWASTYWHVWLSLYIIFFRLRLFLTLLLLTTCSKCGTWKDMNGLASKCIWVKIRSKFEYEIGEKKKERVKIQTALYNHRRRIKLQGPLIVLITVLPLKLLVCRMIRLGSLLSDHNILAHQPGKDKRPKLKQVLESIERCYVQAEQS